MHKWEIIQICLSCIILYMSQISAFLGTKFGTVHAQNVHLEIRGCLVSPNYPIFSCQVHRKEHVQRICVPKVQVPWDTLQNSWIHCGWGEKIAPKGLSRVWKLSKQQVGELVLLGTAFDGSGLANKKIWWQEEGHAQLVGGDTMQGSAWQKE